MQRYRPNSKGITIIELLIVLTIIGIMAGIATPNFTRMVRRNRVKSLAIELLSALRRERSRAISLNRRIQMEIDTTNKTYSVTLEAYTLYDPLSADPFHPKILSQEEPQNLTVDYPFDPRNWLDGLTGSPDPFVVSFTPSGTVQMLSVAIGSIRIEGYGYKFEIKIYKAGQIDMFRI